MMCYHVILEKVETFVQHGYSLLSLPPLGTAAYNLNALYKQNEELPDDSLAKLVA